MNKTKVEKCSTTRKKHGGRVKGTPNKNTEYIFDLCEKNNFDPVLTLIHLANGDWKALGYDSEKILKAGFQGAITEEFVIPVDNRQQACNTLVSYMYPKRKAIEHSVKDEQAGVFTLNYSQQSLKATNEKI